MYEVRWTKKHGRGLYAVSNIIAGDVIETNACAVGDEGGNLVERYCFEYNNDLVCMALGNISLVNHSFRSNAEVYILEDTRFPTAVLKAKKNIKAGQQILINYGYKPNGE